MSRKAWIKLIVIAAAVILLVIIIWQNRAASAQFRFLFLETRMPQILLMIILFALGFVAGILTAFKIGTNRKKKA